MNEARAAASSEHLTNTRLAVAAVARLDVDDPFLDNLVWAAGQYAIDSLHISADADGLVDGGPLTACLLVTDEYGTCDYAMYALADVIDRTLRIYGVECAPGVDAEEATAVLRSLALAFQSAAARCEAALQLLPGKDGQR